MGIRTAGLVLAALLGALPVRADAVRKEPVAFAPGATEATVEGSVSGYDSVEYQLAASAGQQLTLSLGTGKPQAYFNLFAPGVVPGEGSALFVGVREGLRYAGTLKASGTYTVQVLLPRAAARRAESAAYALQVAITGAAAEAASTTLPCTSGAGGPALECSVEVIHPGAGQTTLLVGFPKAAPGGEAIRAGKRRLYFADGQASGSDAPARFTASHADGTWLIAVGGETFEVSDALVGD